MLAVAFVSLAEACSLRISLNTTHSAGSLGIFFMGLCACLVGLCLCACGPDTQSAAEQDLFPLDGVLRLNHVQAKGTHNSYHLQPERTVDDSHRYSHSPLDIQLEEQGVRQFELDVHLSVEGHFEVFHLPGIDEETSCRRFTDCLETIGAWSDGHPGHMPIVVWIEPKDDVESLLPNPGEVLGYELLEGRIGELDDEIIAALSRDKVFTPDDLRGGFDTLPQAIESEGGWPTLGQMRDKIVFALLDGGDHRTGYLEPSQVLAGRMMFVHSDGPEDPFAAAFKINNAVSERERVETLLRSGFIVTSNIDGAGGSEQDSAESLSGSLEAGANFLSSDFPSPIEGFGYSAQIPGGAPARCNPVSAPPQCTAQAIEALSPQ